MDQITMAVTSNQTVATALQQGSAGISFGGAGFLIFYYIGIIEILSSLGVITTSSKIAGASSGALITASQCSGLGTAEILQSAFDLADACRGRQSCSGTLDRELQKLLKGHLPPDAWKRCRDSGFFAISSGTPIGDSEPMLVTDFRSQEDLITAAATSSFIPLWSGNGLFRLFRGLPAFDGGWTLKQPCPPGVKYCIRISSRNPSWPQNRGVGGFLSMLGRVGDSEPESSGSGSSRGAAVVLEKSSVKFTSTGPAGPDLIRLAAESDMDIAPGVFHQVPFSQQQWNDWSLSPAADATLVTIYQLGKADAAAWAKYVGLSKGPEPAAGASSSKGSGVKGGRGFVADNRVQEKADRPGRRMLSQQA